MLNSLFTVSLHITAPLHINIESFNEGKLPTPDTLISDAHLTGSVCICTAGLYFCVWKMFVENTVYILTSASFITSRCTDEYN